MLKSQPDLQDTTFQKLVTNNLTWRTPSTSSRTHNTPTRRHYDGRRRISRFGKPDNHRCARSTFRTQSIPQVGVDFIPGVPRHGRRVVKNRRHSTNTTDNEWHAFEKTMTTSIGIVRNSRTKYPGDRCQISNVPRRLKRERSLGSRS